MAQMFRGLGITIFVIGAIIFFFLISRFSQPSMFSSGGQITPTEILISVLVAFYHLVLGLLCLGIAQLFPTAKSYPSSYATKIEKKEDITGPLPEIQCEQCGTKNPGYQTFCSYCGTPLRAKEGGA